MKLDNELLKGLGLAHPIIQGPFGGGFSTPRLVAAVSNAGGMGSIGAYHLAPQDILNTAAEIRKLTNGPFGINLWVSNHDPGGAHPDTDAVKRAHDRLRPYFAELGIEPAPVPIKTVHSFEDQARAVIEARPAVFSFIFGIPSREILAECKSRGIALAGSATTLAEARALEDAGIDLIVASGFEAGGHRPSFLAPAEESLMGTMALVPQIAQATRLPVIAAGGIANASGVQAALQLGAAAAQVGTAFLACEESGAPELHKRMLFDRVAHRTVLTRAFSGRLARGIRNRIHEELQQAELLPYPAQGWLIGTLREAALAQGRADLVALWCGQSASLLRWRHAADLMAALTGA